MKIGDIQYLKLVDKLMGHTHAKLSPQELKQEIAEITSGAVSSFAETPFGPASTGTIPLAAVPKKRGRPVGSRNKPK